MSGKHIELFLVDGTPGGLTTAEILNWTGQVLSAPRSEMSALVRRAELAGTCVYLLLGPDEQGGTRCYIGETDDFKARLRNHDTNKEFWRKVVVVTSKDANLTKAHGRYLESRLIALALQAGRVVLDNGTTPPLQALPEAHASDMDYFVDQLQIVLPVLGVDAIRGRETVAVPAARQEQLVSPSSTSRTGSSASTPRRSRSTASSRCSPDPPSSPTGTASGRPTAPSRRTSPTGPSTSS